MIEGVVVEERRVIPDERGWLMECLRCDEDIFEKFGQVYVSAVYPGVVKGWHKHRLQDDFVVCLKGMIKLVMFDPRKDSATYGEVDELFIGDKRPVIVKIPRGVYHGWKGIGEETALVLNCPTEPYNYENPDEDRLDPHESPIPYDWSRKDR